MSTKTKSSNIRRIPALYETSWLSWSHDGQYLAYDSVGAMNVMDVSTGRRVSRLVAPKDRGNERHAQWSGDDQFIASCCGDQVYIWEWRSEALVQSCPAAGTILAWHPTLPKLVNVGENSCYVWDTQHWHRSIVTVPRDSNFRTCGWIGNKLYVASFKNYVCVFDVTLASPQRTILDIPTDGIVATSKRGHQAYGLGDDSILLIEPDGTETRLEHHTSPVSSLSFSHDGQLLASRDQKGTLLVWRMHDHLMVAARDVGETLYLYDAEFSPASVLLACVRDHGEAIEFWDLSEAATALAPRSIHYTTAKIALVGDSGVGKTGLGWILTHNGGFREHPSTHGEQFWLAERFSTTRGDGTVCDAVVWDLAGQPDYRLIHSLFIGDADVAIVVFDPTNRQDPLKGAEFWLRALRASKEKTCDVILVGARIDRGTGILSDSEIDAFARSHAVAGGYIATSAMRGDGIDALTARIAELIGWEKRQPTVTLEVFKEIRDHVLDIKARESADVLVTLEELRGRLQGLAGKSYELRDIDIATKHLSHHGFVRPLRNGRGEHFVLLAPDLLNNLAASMVLEARRNPKGLGALHERRVVNGDYDFPELAALKPHDREILLDTATTLFIEHNVCFRETLGNDPFLVFPSLINQNKPPLENIAVVDGTAYTATGATENVYASLVVLLGYTNTFTRTNQWRDQAQYEMGRGQVCGFRLAEEREGEIDLVLYFGVDAASSTKQLFQGLFEKFLLTRDVEIEIFPPVQCPKCKYAQPRSEVVKRQREQAKAMFCSNCGKKVPLPERILTAPVRTAPAEVLDREERTAGTRTQFEKAVTWLKSYLRDTTREPAPSCFISYAWGDATQERWVERNLATDVRNAGVEVFLDRWHNKPGTSISRFIEQIERVDFVLLLGTPRLRAKYDGAADAVVEAELRLINTRLGKKSKAHTVVPLLLDGEQSSSFPPLAKDSVFIDFRSEDHYFERVLDLLLTLYRIPFDEPAMRDLRDTIRDAADRRRRR